MRKIKFRAWDNVQEKMLPVERINFRDGYVSLNEGDNSVTDTFEIFELMQYTGLKDKNGKEIYEGDIVIFNQQTIGSLIEDGYTGIVKFEECCFTVDNKKKQESVPIFDEIGIWEVIGNIYEHEDLANQLK